MALCYTPSQDMSAFQSQFYKIQLHDRVLAVDSKWPLYVPNERSGGVVCTFVKARVLASFSQQSTSQQISISCLLSTSASQSFHS